MRIEVLYFEGCPNHEALLPRLRDLLTQVDADTDVELRQVEDLDAAEREQFLGSPTLRIDGVDVEPRAATRRDYGLKCRLFATADGLQGIPPDERILDALQRAGARAR